MTGAGDEQPYPPISDYGLIGDCHGAGLISTAGSIDWCCFHRFDSRPVFDRILDWDKGGYWQMSPCGPCRMSRRYQGPTNILETSFKTATGAVSVTDAMLATPDSDPHHLLIRVVKGIEGSVAMRSVFHPRFDHSLSVPRLRLYDERAGIVLGGADALLLQTDVKLEQSGQCTCTAEITVEAGDELVFLLTAMDAHLAEESAFDRAAALNGLATTERSWNDWAGSFTYDGPHRDLVMRSAVVLRSLTYAPTGAMVAAPTTSLPETIGGQRNWDYRYTWLRDSSFVIHSFFALGFEEEATSFIRWLLRTTAGGAENMQVLYGVGGERIIPESELTHLSGYRDSAPVRIGNDARLQFQLDIFGEMVDTLHLFHKEGGDIDDQMWELVVSIAELVVKKWRCADDGLWEARAEPRHHVHSKVMCWAALDRAVKLAQATEREPDHLSGWESERDVIKAEVLDKGYRSGPETFVGSYGSDDLDAAALRFPLVGFLPADDERVVATATTIAAELGQDELIRRYNSDDGLPGSEGSFTLCSFWMVDNLLMQGRVDEGRALLEKILGHANDLGLMSEEIGLDSGDALGNFPQAFTHVALINSVLNLAQAEAEGRCTTCRG
jgi:GH15 family glucan-1,4-alpha-glucosidase